MLFLLHVRCTYVKPLKTLTPMLVLGGMVQDSLFLPSSVYRFSNVFSMLKVMIAVSEWRLVWSGTHYLYYSLSGRHGVGILASRACHGSRVRA